MANTVSQIVRNRKRNENDNFDKSGVSLDVKPSRWKFETSNPTIQDMERLDFWVNTATGDVFEKLLGPTVLEPDGWQFKYNYGTGTGGGLNDLANIGSGIGLFQGLSGTTADLRTLISKDNKIGLQITGSNNEIELNVQNLTPDDVELGFVKNEVNPVRDKPQLSNLEELGPDRGVFKGSLGTVNSGSLYVCSSVNTSVSPNTSVWTLLTTTRNLLPAWCNLFTDPLTNPTTVIPRSPGPPIDVILQTGQITFNSSENKAVVSGDDFSIYTDLGSTFIQSGIFTRTSDFMVNYSGIIERNVSSSIYPNNLEYELFTSLNKYRSKVQTHHYPRLFYL